MKDELLDNVKRMIRDGKMVEPGQVLMGPRKGEQARMSKVRDVWLVEGGLREGIRRGGWGGDTRPIRLSEVFDRWERMGKDLSRPFTVVVDTVGQTMTVEQERESG